MYKVFFNEKKISFALRGKITLNKPSYLFNDSCTSQDVREWFFSFIENKESEIVLVHSNRKEFYKIFESAFKIIYASGGVVCQKNKILFIYRNEKWDLPKGKIDKGEIPEEAALREVEEECGISNHYITKKLRPTFHIYKSPHSDEKKEWILKKTYWFEMKYEGNKKGVPQKEEGITKLEWLEKSNLSKVLLNTYENLLDLIRTYSD